MDASPSLRSPDPTRIQDGLHQSDEPKGRATKTLKIKNLLSVVVVVKNFKAGLTLTETSYRMHY